MMKTTKKICSRGHTFYKSSDCPVCPKCWPARTASSSVAGGSGYYREKNKGDLPERLGTPALRALLNAKIYNLQQLSEYSEKEVLKLHGMGPASIPFLTKALHEKGLKFREM